MNMAPLNLTHRRTHNLLLISKLLSLRDTASPLTLLLDSLEQPATPLIKEYLRRAKVSLSDCAFLPNVEVVGSLSRLSSSGVRKVFGANGYTNTLTVIKSSRYVHRIRDIKTARWSRRVHFSQTQECS